MNSLIFRSVIPLTAFAYSFCAVAQENEQSSGTQRPVMTAVDMVELKKLSKPNISLDGNIAGYLQDDIDWKRNRKVDRLILRNTETGEALRSIEPSKWTEDVDEIAWAPDSKSFLTILDRKGDKYDQVYQFDIASGDLKPLTKHQTDVKNVVWSPDGKGFYFESNNLRQEAKDDDWSPEAYEYRDYEELFYFDLSKNSYTRLLTGETIIVDFSVARDGSALLVSMRNELPKNEKESNEVWLISRNGEAQQLTDNMYQERDAKLSPDKSHFAFMAEVNEAGNLYHEENLFVQAVGSDTPRLLFPETPVEVLQFEWDETGKGIYFLGNIGLTTQLFHCDIATGQMRQITHGNHELENWNYSPQSGRHIAQRSDANSPSDIVLIDQTTGALTVLSPELANLSTQFALPKQEAFRWQGADGTQLEGLLVYPVGYKSGESFPLVTISHGGPRSSTHFGSWNISRYVPVLAGQGYGIFLPNYRGGTGYGDAFMRDMIGNYFNNSDDDVLTGIDALVEAGLADPKNLIAMGWSAGGHMTNWLIGQTDRFVAASSGAGVSDWVSMYGESDFRRNRTFHFGGPPWTENAPYEVFHNTSPLTYAWRVHTPTLFFSGEEDERVPPTQGIMMYRALNDLGVETQLYIVDNEPHNFKKPSHQLFKINRELAWYAQHRGLEYVPVLPQLPDEDEDEE